MNYLAHAYRSFHLPDILVGNMISDFVKGKKKYEYSEGILKGIDLHRSIDTFTDEHEATKQAILADIKTDFDQATGAIVLLPRDAKKAVKTALLYYEALYRQLEHTPATKLQQERVRVSDAKKAVILLRSKVGLHG